MISLFALFHHCEHLLMFLLYLLDHFLHKRLNDLFLTEILSCQPISLYPRVEHLLTHFFQKAYIKKVLYRDFKKNYQNHFDYYTKKNFSRFPSSFTWSFFRVRLNRIHRLSKIWCAVERSFFIFWIPFLKIHRRHSKVQANQIISISNIFRY